MADDIHSSAAGLNHSEPKSSTQLEYPQLLIEASFESLLSHSHTSGCRPSAAMPRSELSLSESWSSLSEHELSHDDDLHSETTDTGSLIDVSHAEDIHSVDEHGHSSDAEEDHDEGVEYQDNRDVLHDSDDVEGRYLMSSYQSQYSSIRPRASIRLDDSTIVVDESGISSLQASKTFTEIETRSTSSQRLSGSTSDDSVGTISMKLASEGLRLVQPRPYHILYHASALSSSEMKSDILSKVGAALISAGDHHEFDSDSEYPCYHVVPSEFGPGLHPSTADLIPIPTQMHVSECTVVPNAASNVYYPRIQLQLANGKQIVSRRAKFYEFQNEQQWPPPDLAVILVSQNEHHEGRSKAMKVAEFANRHRIPFFCLQQEAGWDGSGFLTDVNPDMLHKVLQTKAHHERGEVGRKMLLDVDSFLALDTEQFSQHLSYLTVATKCRSTPHLNVRGQVMSQLGKTFHQFTRLLPHRYAKVLNGDMHDDFSQEWIAEVVTPQSKVPRPQAEEKHASLHALNLPRERAFMFATFVKTTAAIVVTGLAVLLIYASSIALPHMISRFSSAPKTLPVGPHGIIAPPCLTSVVSSATTIATTASTQGHSTSGPLQVLEQHVQSLMPISIPRGRKRTHKQTSDQSIVEYKDVVATVCHNVVPAYISANIKVDTTFFDEGNPVFHVDILRNGEKVSAKVEKQASGAAMVMVRRKDVHGQLTIHLNGPKQQVCAFVDLENSVGEAFTLWIESLRSRSGQFKTTKRFANEYTRLLEVRTTKPGLINSAIEMQYSAAQKIGAAVEMVERSAVKHAKVCHEDKNKCFQLVNTDILSSAQRARRITENLLETTRKQIAGTTQQARNRANGVSEQVHEEISKAVQAVQSSIAELSLFPQVWPRKVTETLAEAQKQAQNLVKKSPSNRKKSPKAM